MERPSAASEPASLEPTNPVAPAMSVSAAIL
jgi:hypothetical protein